MSGCIKVNDETAWIAATWAYNAVVRFTREHVQRDGAEALITALDNAVYPRFSWLDLRELSQTDKANLLVAMKAAYRQEEERGGEGWRDRSFFPGFMKKFGELIELVTKESP